MKRFTAVILAALSVIGCLTVGVSASGIWWSNAEDIERYSVFAEEDVSEFGDTVRFSQGSIFMVGWLIFILLLGIVVSLRVFLRVAAIMWGK